MFENVYTACHRSATYNLFQSVCRLPSYWREEKVLREKARSLLQIMGLEERRDIMADNLPYGLQRRLEITRALALDPKLLLLDEPSLGLAPLLVKTVFEIISEFKALGKTILLVEQNAHKALQVADRAYVLEQGRIIKTGPAHDIAQDPAVRAAYLGTRSVAKD
ncbi:MAG: ATP-binding cassette domain-containing protein [Holophaga sp.]